VKKFRFFLQKTVFALCLFAAGGRVFSAEAKKSLIFCAIIFISRLRASMLAHAM